MAELRPPKGATKKKRIIGRGQGSNRGGTSGKGSKGQNARAGGGVRPGFEGGQMPLFRRIARRGFSNYRSKKHFQIINVGALADRFSDGDSVTTETLVAKRLVKGNGMPIKLLGNGELDKKLNVTVDALSESARAKIEAAGGTIQSGGSTE
ncbi:MAG TPA: 50S ribosomal protein L15 [Spirochaetia bacterium]|nr:50S ribosomal protein L15 [Spirochaetia bacterium]HUZ18676.1 50S ribosomal protein L15 [Spirochaetia bacterium]